MIELLTILMATMLNNSIEVTRTQKSGKSWVIDYGYTACTLNRELDSEQMSIALERDSIQR